MVLSRTRRLGSHEGSQMVLAAIAVACAGCGDRAARVALVPRGDCARPTGGNLVTVTAYTASGERSRSLGLDETLSIADFPADTEQIGVEVVIGDGEIGAAGKSAPLSFGELADGATIPVFMGPPDGFCPIGPMTEPRGRPLVARAGEGALIVGGVGVAGPLATAEYYDPAADAFTPVAVPEALVDEVQGFAGAALATLPDGRVALIGGPSNALVVFDPQARAFSTPALIVSRSFHGAIATGDEDVLVAGGCSAVINQVCGGVPRLQTALYDLGEVGNPELTAILPAGSRAGARLFDLGIQLDGRRRFLLAGGSGDPPRAERFALDDVDAEVVHGGHMQAVALDGGAVLTAFADDAAPVASGTASVFAPDAASAQAVAKAPDLATVRLVALEDGRVAGFGGESTGDEPKGRVLTYDPTRDAWSAALPETNRTGTLTAPSLARLADGTVLVIDGAVSDRAWRYRPSLVGPASGSVTAVPASNVSRGVLTASDPATVTRVAAPPAWTLMAPGAALAARALVGGPRVEAGSVRATVRVRAGGVALIAQQTGPGRAIVAELAPDQPPRLVRLEGARVLCSAPAALAAFDPAIAVTLRLAIAGAGAGSTARLTIDDRELLVCDVGATERGAWGVAALGAAAQVTVDSITVAR